MKKLLTRPRILLADDHNIVRDGLGFMLEKDFEIVGDVKDGNLLVKEADRLAPDLIVVDISMPILNGIEATRRIRRLQPKTRIVVFTMHADATFASEVLDAGASAYVLKSAPSEEIQSAIRAALNGKTYVTPRLAQDVVPFSSAAARSPKPRGRLTPRQREVLQLLAEGRPVKEIADLLCVSHRTVEFHKYRIMQELGLSSSAQLTLYAVTHGIMPVPRNDSA